MNDTKETHSQTHAFIAGGASALAAGYSCFIFEGIKKRLQSNQPLPNLMKSGPKIWLKESFRGSTSFAWSSIPSTVIQQMTSNYCKEQNLSHTLSGKTIEAIFAGALGGFPATIIGNLLLEQQLKKTGPKEAFFNLLTQGNTRIFRGLTLVMTREAMFGFCYLKGMQDAGNYASTHYGASYVLPAQLCVGILGSLASHPADTIATTMQQYNYSRISSATEHLWKENKAKAFFKGGAARIGLFSMAMLVIGDVQEKVLSTLEAPK